MKLAFIQVASWGDCCNSTMMFRPLLNKYVGAQLHVFTSIPYQSAFLNNPLITAIHASPAAGKHEAFSLYDTLPAQVRKMGIFDRIYCPAPILMGGRRNSLRHPEVGENLWCSFWRALEEDDVPYEIPLLAEITLTATEQASAKYFLSQMQKPKAGKKRVLMECYAESGQTYWNEQWMDQVARLLLDQGHQVILSNKSSTRAISALVKAGAILVTLPLRECIEIFNHSDMFISISSGFCNACRSTAATKSDGVWLEAVNSPTVSSRTLVRKGATGVNEFYYENDLKGFLRLVRKYA